MWKVDDETKLSVSAAKGGAFLMGSASRWRFPARIFTAGGRLRRACLVLTLLCCSPVLVPLVCLSFPPLCVAALCLRLRKQQPPPDTGEAAAFEGAAAGGRDAVVLDGWLLQRYLEDQMGLVGAALDSGDADGCQEY